jgi:hypothetical protein
MSDPKAPAATEADIYSYLFSDTAGTRAVPPILSLHVARWANAPASGLKGVVAEIFQCWYDKDATGNAQPSWHHSLAKFTIDLAPNPAASATPDGKGSPPEMVISNPKLTTTYGRKGTALSKPVKADDADFIFSMGGTNTFPIVVPEKFKDSGEARNNPHLHGDAGKHRIGVELTAVVDKGTVKYSALDWDHTLRSTIQCSDPVDRMLALQTTPMGAFKTITDAKDQCHRQGRQGRPPACRRRRPPARSRQRQRGVPHVPAPIGPGIPRVAEVRQGIQDVRRPGRLGRRGGRQEGRGGRQEEKGEVASLLGR